VSTAAGIRLDAVSKRYATPAGTVVAVDAVTLDVEPGTSLAITGPSGCGKSTLLGLIGGLETPTAGRITIGGREISRLPDRQRARLRRNELGLVFQSDNLLPFLTAAENVSLQLALSGAGDDRGRGRDVLARLGLDDDADKLPDHLSGGQRQRVAVARALVHRPRVILADEPTGALDADNSTVVVNLLLAAQRDAGSTLIVVTHDARVARRLDRTVRLRDGRLADDDVAAIPRPARTASGA
jgi:putative ABC transport system ATP-binding protein